MHILVVEDNDLQRQALVRGLGSAGYHSTACIDGLEGLEAARAHSYDLLILDIMLPKLSGIELLSTLRGEGMLQPVLLLTARDAVEDRVDGLDCGADDYLVKPYLFAELLARVRALTRRRPAAQAEPELAIGAVRLDSAGRQLDVAGEKVALTPREYSVFAYLMQHRGECVPRAVLCSQLYESTGDTASNALDVSMSRLRRKLHRFGYGDVIRTRRGRGYYLQSPKAGDP